MKKITLGLALALSTAIFANDYATSYPSNAERIGSIIAVRDITKQLSEKLSELQSSTYDVRKLSTSSKLKFCMNVGEVNSLNSLLAQKVEDITPPPPTMYNREQSHFVDTSREFHTTISNKIRALKDYCNGDRKLSDDYRNELVGDMRTIGMNTYNEYSIQNPSSALLAPMTITELRKVTEQEKDQEEVVQKKNCTLF